MAKRVSTTKYWTILGSVKCPKCGRKAMVYSKGKVNKKELLVCPYHTLLREQAVWEDVDLREVSPGIYKSIHEPTRDRNYNEDKIMDKGPNHRWIDKELRSYYWNVQDGTEE